MAKIIAVEVSGPIEVGGFLGVGIKAYDVYHFMPIQTAEFLGLTNHRGPRSLAHTIFLRVGSTYEEVAVEMQGPRETVARNLDWI